MAAQSKIEWTHCTWNPVTGCTKMSEGCRHCYAERYARRLQAMGQPKYKNGFKVTLHESTLSLPLGWRKSHVVFVNSMGDLFHDEIPFEFIAKVFAVMGRASRHCFQLLTKRSARLIALSPDLPWPANVWTGVTVERADYSFRIPHLRRTGAKTKFLCLEPLLGPLPSLNLKGIDWIILGGESGPGARLMKKEWVLDVRDQCLRAGVAFFFKQWGGVNKKKSGRILEGRFWDDTPPLPGQAEPLLPLVS